jgi:uncharacterized membrane protein
MIFKGKATINCINIHHKEGLFLSAVMGHSLV